MALPPYSNELVPHDGDLAPVVSEPTPQAFALLEVDEPREVAAEPMPSAARPSSADSSGTSSNKRSASSDSKSLAEGSSGNSNETHLIRKTRRPRKATYTVRKEETDRLEKEAATLESRVRVLMERAQERLTDEELLNAILNEARRGQQLSFAVAQSVVSGFLSAEVTNPLHTFIHLGNDWTHRKKTLLGMKEKKIRNAYDYVRARSQFLDPLKAHHSKEQYESANGDYCCTRFEITQFEDGESVKQIYNTVLAYLFNIEISVSEQLGHITVREDYDNVEKSSISSFRLLSTLFGVTVETHIVMFAKYYESHELSNGKPCGIITLDCVDQDELYPYAPKERVRKDYSHTLVLTPHMRKKGTNGEEEELVVVMALGKFLKLHKAEFEIPPHTLKALRDSICWGPVMKTTMNKMLHPELRSLSGKADSEENKHHLGHQGDCVAERLGFSGVEGRRCLEAEDRGLRMAGTEERDLKAVQNTRPTLLLRNRRRQDVDQNDQLSHRPPTTCAQSDEQ